MNTQKTKRGTLRSGKPKKEMNRFGNRLSARAAQDGTLSAPQWLQSTLANQLIFTRAEWIYFSHTTKMKSRKQRRLHRNHLFAIGFTESTCLLRSRKCQSPWAIFLLYATSRQRRQSQWLFVILCLAHITAPRLILPWKVSPQAHNPSNGSTILCANCALQRIIEFRLPRTRRKTASRWRVFKNNLTKR